MRLKDAFKKMLEENGIKENQPFTINKIGPYRYRNGRIEYKIHGSDIWEESYMSLTKLISAEILPSKGIY